MSGRRKTDFDFSRVDDSVEWDIRVDRDIGYDGMDGRTTSVRRRYFTITLPHALLIGASVASGMIGGAFVIGYALGIA